MDATRSSSRRARLARGTLIAVCLLWSGPARADISVRSSLVPQRAQVGEPLTLSIEISGAQDVSAPAIANLNGFDVRYVGPSTQISIINGRMDASVQHRYSLLPLQPGHFTLGPFIVDYQGKSYQTATFAVDITAAAQAPAPPGAAAPGTQAGQRAAASQALRLVLSVPRQDVYLHERVPADVTLYVGAVRVADVQYPTLPGTDLSVDKFPEPSQHRQVIDGETFQVLHFQSTIVPLRAGSLTLGPATLQLNVLTPQRRGGPFNDPFFERFLGGDAFSERRPQDLHSEPVALNVLPLPEEGKPADFSAAVGTFSMQVTGAPTELNAGDPVTLRVNITGTGNLADAAPPQLTRPEGFRTYEPRAVRSDPGSAGGLAASKSFEQVLIVNDASVRQIPPVQFSYFDPQARRYNTLESQPIALVVRAPQNLPRSEVVTAGGGAQRSVQEEKLGRDIVYIKDDTGRLTPIAGRRHLPLLLWQPAPPLLFLAALLYERRRRRLHGDLRYARFTRAGKHARRGLAKAEQALARGDRHTFYDAVSRAMQEYLAAKLDLPPGGIDADAATGRDVSDESVQRIRTFFATCEQVRFAPGSGDGDMRGTLSLAQDLVKRLERERRLAPAEASRGAA